MVVTCPHCGAKNRIDPAQARIKQPVCGRCHAPLPVTDADGHPVELTDATFDAFLQQAGDTPVLVDCWAPWCGPCRMLAPTLEQLAAEANGRYVIAKLNTDENQRTAAMLRISAIPTMVIYKGGRPVTRLEGLRSKQDILAQLVG